MAIALRKWKAVFDIYFQDGLAYRASGIIWIMTDLVTAVTMPLVWASAARSGPIQGYTTGDFVLYYLCLLLLQSFITSHIMWEVATEIKEGQFTPLLLRPVSLYQFLFFRNIAWRVIRISLFAPIFVVLLYLYRGFLGGAHVNVGWEFLASLVLGHLVSFTFVVMMSSLALYVQEVFSIFELYYGPMLFMSGTLFPIGVMPAWFRSIVPFFPFYYTTGAPTEILVGRVTGDAMHRTLMIQCAWVAICYVVGKLLYRRGLKHYSSVGM